MIIECRNLSKNYGGTAALNDITLTIGEGVTGLIGPNGAGKSTLIKIILGLMKPSRGTVRVFGLDPWVDGERIRKRIGVLHEKPVFPSWVTGYELLKFTGRLRGLRNLEEEIEETLKHVGLWNVRDKRIGEYSAGMVQRLGIAQAILGYPELVILDEPTANLDPEARKEVIELIKKIKEEKGSSFLISTHILSELEEVCEYVIILEEGEVLDRGALRELASKYYAYSLTVRASNPLGLIEVLKNLDYVKDLALKGDEVTLSTSNPELLADTLSKYGDEVGIVFVKENPRLLERIYLKATGKRTIFNFQ